MLVSPDHLLAQAHERFATHDYYGAVHFLEELVDGGHAFADVHHLLGVSLTLLDQRERAIAAFDRALELNPRYVEALMHRGLVLAELGRDAEAAESFRLASAAVPPSTAGFPGRIAGQLANLHASLGEAYAEAGALSEAIAQYRRALELGPEFHDLRHRLARLLLEAGQAQAARAELTALLERRPGFGPAAATLGLAHYLSGDADGAIAVWRDCVAHEPENAQVEAYLAMAERAAR